jgi:hypothetical protein
LKRERGFEPPTLTLARRPEPILGKGIGILKDLFGWAGKYQGTRGGVHSQTPPSDMGAFPLRVGLSGPYDMDHAQPCAPWWRVGGGNGQRESVGSRTEPEARVGLGCLQELVNASRGSGWGAGG